ncbi:MAG: hypothetical protein ACFFBH_12630 [Promethearchaeota archaeon]
MAVTKRIIIESIIVVILIAYFYTSLLLTILSISISIQTFEAKFWFLNLVTSIVLSFVFTIIHLIIRNYSLNQIKENLKLRKLKKVERFKMFYAISTLFITVPIFTFSYIIFFIHSENLHPIFILMIISASIGLIFFIIGACLNPSKNQEKSELKVVPSTIILTKKSPIKSQMKNYYIVFFILNLVVIIPIFAFVFIFVFKLDLILIILVISQWAIISIIMLLYLNTRKKQDSN